MKALILWADNRSANLGVRALAAGTAELAKRAWGAVDLEFQDFSASEIGFSLGKSAVARDVFRRNGPIKSWLRDFDVVLDTGAGDSFADIYGVRRLAMMAYTHHAAFSQGLPVYLTPQTIGPFNSRVGKVIGSRSLRGMAGIMTRDGVSASFAESMGYVVDVYSTDVVFALKQPPVKQARDVILNVSGLLWSPNTHVDSVTYQQETRELLFGLRDAGRSVTLMAHVLENPSVDNDVRVLDEISEEFRECDIVIPADLDDARSELASAQVVVGSRMHACLNALSVGTPSIPWAYSRKFAPLLEAIEWPISIDLRSCETAAASTLRLLHSWPQKSGDARVARVQAQAEERLQSAAAFLRKRSRLT